MSSLARSFALAGSLLLVIAPLSAAGPPEEKVKVEGRVLPPTEDGVVAADVWKSTRLELAVEAARGTSHYSIRPDEQGRFEFTFPSDGALHIICRADGFAPAFHGPVAIGADGRGQLDIRLDRGFTGRVRLRTPRGEPIVGAELFAAYADALGARHTIGRVTTDAEGVAAIERCPDSPLWLELRARGWEHDIEEDVELTADEPFVWVPRPAIGTRGRVVSSSGDPVAGAELRLRTRTEPFPIQYLGSAGPVVATTRDDGRFTLATLRRDTSYGFIVDAEGHGAVVLDQVSAGDRDIEVKLPPEVRVRGTVRGDLSQLSERRGQRRIGWSDVLRSKTHSSSDFRWADVEVQGERGTFEIRDALGSHVRIGEETYELPTDGVTVLDVEVVLEEERTAELPMRSLVVEFVVQGAEEPLSGTVRMYSHAPDDPGRRRSIREFDHPLEGGRAKLEVHAPGTVEIEPRRTRGFTFEEQEIAVPAGDDEMVVRVEARRAGSITGVVLEPDGSKARRSLNVSCYPLREGARPLHNFDVDATGRFEVTPLELGEDYIVSVSRGKVMVLSDPVRVDGEVESPDIRLRVVEGVSARGRLVGEDGLPIGGVEVTASFRSEVSSHSYSPGTVSSRLGYFDLGEFNPAVGTMSAQVVATADYQPRLAALPDTGERVDVVLEPGHVVEGRLVDADTGMGVPGIVIYAMPADFSKSAWKSRFPAEGETGADGSFRISTLPDMECRLGIDSTLRFVDEAWRVTPGSGDEVLLRVSPRR